MEKISVVIITKNSERTIKNALESVKYFDEIILVDSGSTDGTIKIAEKYGAIIYKKDWEGYGKQKIYAVSKAKNEWVFSLDSDEAISEELRNKIIASDFSSADGFRVPILTYFLNKPIRHCNWYPEYHLRLFNKTKMMFEDKEVHEKVVGSEKIGKIDGDILHYSYKSIEDYLEKFNIYTTLESKLDKYKKTKIGFAFYLLMIFKPMYKFLNMYIWHLGFLDGVEGFMVCTLSSYYSFVVLAKVLERQYDKK